MAHLSTGASRAITPCWVRIAAQAILKVTNRQKEGTMPTTQPGVR
jgi:hypothetical protein